MRGLKLCLAVIVLFSVASISYAAPTVNVEAGSEEEKAVLARSVQNVYPYLPESQQELIRKGLYFVVVSDSLLGRNAAAFGPEDDPSYRYPDTKLYPEGTIKVNIPASTLHMMRIVDGDKGSDVSQMRGLLLEIIAHEIKHVEQYMAKPIKALSRPAECPKGVCDASRLEDTRLKLAYELEAMRFGQEVRNAAAEKTGGFFGARLGKPVEGMAALVYSAMYEPAVLAKKCDTNGFLSGYDKLAAEQYLGSASLSIRIYPYLVPVLMRLKSCAE